MANPTAPAGAPLTPAAAQPPARPPRRRRARALIDVSVCIANWNCRDLLRACLESLHDQAQGATLETIVVDNGSADGAADMVEREFPEVLLIRNADYARDAALWHVRAEPIQPYLAPDTVQNAVQGGKYRGADLKTVGARLCGLAPAIEGGNHEGGLLHELWRGACCLESRRAA